jgi:carboxylesterase
MTPQALPPSGSSGSAGPSAAAGPGRPLMLRAGPVGVLLFHGLASVPAELMFLARGLHRAGYTVQVPVLAGYSFGTGDLPGRERAWGEAALAAFDSLRATCDAVVVGGLCIGAVLALQVAAQRGTQVHGVLALSTTLHYDGWATPWYRRLLPLAAWVPGAGRIGVRETEPYGVKDERMRAWIRAQMADGVSDAGAAVLRVDGLLAARRLMRRVRAQLSQVLAPTLVVHARDDDAASPRSACEVVQRVRAPQVQLVLLADSFHMISIDREKHLVLARMTEFLARLPLPVAGAASRPATPDALRRHGPTPDNLVRLPFPRNHRSFP